MRRLSAMGGMGMVALVCSAAVVGCDKQTTRPFGSGKTRASPQVKIAAVAPVPPPVCETRPDWWHESPRKSGGVLSVCAGAEDRDLLAARRRAVENARQRFLAASGSLPIEPDLQADSARLQDGTFRAFVRLWARVP